LSDVPEEGILSSGVPAALGALVKTLTKFGRLPLAEVVEPALDYARRGFPLQAGLYGQERFGIRDLEEKFRS
jgi:gamma-glutamyltranspeptidase/glutathione hydrolase